MRSTVPAAAFIAASYLLVAPGRAWSAPVPTPTPSVSPSAAPAGASAQVMVGPMPGISGGGDSQMLYDRFTDGATSQAGLFTVWRKQGQIYLELSPAQLDHPYMLVPILASGLGEGLFAGIDFDTILLQFHRNGPSIITSEQNPYGKAHAGSPAALAVGLSFPPSVISADPITAIDKSDGDVVFPASVFLT